MRRPRGPYAVGLALCVLLILGPVVFGALLQVPGIIYPNDCDIAARCEHAIVEIAMSLSFGLVFVGPILMLFGGLGLIVLGAIWGFHAFRKESKNPSVTKYARRFLGAACVSVLLYLVYIPGGPDPCSRTLTDTRYEQCVEEIFSEMSVTEARQWLELHGYRLTEVRPYSGGFSAASDLYARKQTEYRHDFIFEAARSYGPGKSVPYGTNFNRIFARIGPAPERFELYLFGVQEDDIVFGVKADWSFSFL